MQKYLGVLGFITIIIGLILIKTTYIAYMPIFLIIGIIGLALSTRNHKIWGGFTFSLWILAGVVTSLAYPQHFLQIGSFKLELLIVPLLQIIMFGMGSQMSLKDFQGVLKMPKGVIIGVVCQFTIMPIVGFTIASAFGFPPEIAAGIILVGSSPSGLASNVMSFIAKANLALSVTLTACATMLAPFLTPLLMRFFASEMITIDVWDMMIGIFNMVILPICAGLLFNVFAFDNKSNKTKAFQTLGFFGMVCIKNGINFFDQGGTVSSLLQNIAYDGLKFLVVPIILAVVLKYYLASRREAMNKVLSFISMLAIAVIIVVITASGRDSLLEVGFTLILACLLHNVFGYGLGYSVGKLLKLEEQDCRTIALEVGMQNGGLASGLALQMGKVATVGLAPAVFGPIMNISGSTLASWWKTKPPKTNKVKE